MTDEFEVKGLDVSLDDLDNDGYDFYTKDRFQQDLMNIFEVLGVFMTKSIISVIDEYCKPGMTYVHTRDGGEFTLSIKALKLSKLLSIEAELRPFDPIHLVKCSGRIFSYVSKYLTHHNGIKPEDIPKPVRSSNLSASVKDPWDVEFANSLSKREVFQVILISNYIDCESLMHLMCAKIATQIRGKGPDEIRDILSEEDDDEKEQNNESEQTQSGQLSICMCGYVWQEDTEADIEDEANQEELKITE